MKKSLIALAVMAASGASFAQSTVTLYGIADIWFGQTKSTGQPSQIVLESGGVSNSRWGLKGSEDLGGGLKANFLLETGFDLDTGAGGTAGFNRYAYIGFSGGFGEVKLGKVGTAYDDITSTANSAFDSDLKSVTNVWVSNGIDTPNNNIHYATPSFGGFSGAVSYSLGENKDTPLPGSAANSTSFYVQYAGGPLLAVVGYQTDEPQGGGASSDYTRLAATYDLGVAKLLAGYGKASMPLGAESTEWQIGADVPLSSALTLSGGYARSKDNAAAGDDKRTGYGLAVAYSLSKRTTTYAGYHNDKTTPAVGASTTTKILAVGVKHTF